MIKKSSIIGGGLFVLLLLVASPVWITIALNTYKAARLENDLTSVFLPARAKLIGSSSRVYNSGNGIGCDYQALAIVSYRGKIENLANSYIELLKRERYLYGDGSLYLGNNNSSKYWSAKIINLSTELYITPNIDNTGYYLIRFELSPRTEGLDLRCM